MEKTLENNMDLPASIEVVKALKGSQRYNLNTLGQEIDFNNSERTLFLEGIPEIKIKRDPKVIKYILKNSEGEVLEGTPIVKYFYYQKVENK